MKGPVDSVMKTTSYNSTGRWSKDFKCVESVKTGQYARNCRNKSKFNSYNNNNQLWCSNCRSSTLSDNACRRKDKAGKDKVSQISDTTEDDHTFSFKVSVSCDTDAGHERTDMLLVDCGATSYIITDESQFVSFDESFRPENHFVELADGTRSNKAALKRGDANVSIVDVNGRRITASLKDALYIPSYPQNIFSLQAATKRGATVTFQPDHAEIIYKTGVRFDIEKHGRLYYLNTYGNSNSDSVNYACDLKGWHEILGHCNYDDILNLENVVNGMKVTNITDKPSDCNTCVMGKTTQGRSRKPDARSGVPLGLVHTDLAGPIDLISKEGFRYAIAFTDDYSGAVFVYFIESKRDVVAATEKFLADSAPFGNVKRMRSENGTEFTSEGFKKLLRKNHNRRLKQTPYFALTGRMPNLSNKRAFGSECCAYRQNKGKLDPRCSKGICVGCDRRSPAYLVYFPATGKVGKYRVV